MGFAQTAAASMISTCKYVLVCTISVLRLDTEAVAGEVHGPNHSTHIFSYTHCKEAATAIFWGDGPSRSHFLCLFEVFFLRGVPLRPLGVPLACPRPPRSLFQCILGTLGAHFGTLWGSWGSPGSTVGVLFRARGSQKTRKWTPRLESGCDARPSTKVDHQNLSNVCKTW